VVKFVENPLRLATNVFVHNPEAKPGKIEASRLVAHRWSEEVVRVLEKSDWTDEKSTPDLKENKIYTER